MDTELYDAWLRYTRAPDESNDVARVRSTASIFDAFADNDASFRKITIGGKTVDAFLRELSGG